MTKDTRLTLPAHIYLPSLINVPSIHYTLSVKCVINHIISSRLISSHSTSSHFTSSITRDLLML